MSTFKRYYLQETGYLGGRRMGIILNRDSSVYTGHMSKKDEEPDTETYHFNVPLLAYDSIDVRANGDEHNQVIDVLFVQKKDESNDVVSAFRLHSAEQMEELIVKLMSEMKSFRKGVGGLFDFEAKRNRPSDLF
jgi:hypothetical protein